LHLQATFPLSPTPFSSLGARKRANGWQDPKNHKNRSNSSSDNKQHKKYAPSPLPSTTPLQSPINAQQPSQSPINAQQPSTDPKHEPLASAQHPEASKFLTLNPAIHPFHTPLEKDESNDIIMATAPPSWTQKHPHESDNSDSDKEAPFASAAQDSGISSDHMALVAKVVEPINSSGWIDVRKKKGRKDPLWPTQ